MAYEFGICQQAAVKQRATMLHEIGHAIDYARSGDANCRRTDVKWNEDECELVATGYGRQLAISAGLPIGITVEQYDEYYASAGMSIHCT